MTEETVPTSITLSGSGFLGIYHIGVVGCLRAFAPHLLKGRVGGASSGNFTTLAVCCDIPLSHVTFVFLRTVAKIRRSRLNLCQPGLDLNQELRGIVDEMLPPDAHVRCSNRLYVSLTRFKDRKNLVVSEFESREELIQVILCSCFIPGVCGVVPPIYKGEHFIDGAFSDNMPILDHETITVSPFAGTSDICPKQKGRKFLLMNVSNTTAYVTPPNITSAIRILFPSDPDALDKLMCQGFDDTLKFLQSRQMVQCEQCSHVRREAKIDRELEKNPDPDEEDQIEDVFCKGCREKRDEVFEFLRPENPPVVEPFEPISAVAVVVGSIPWYLNNACYILSSLLDHYTDSK